MCKEDVPVYFFILGIYQFFRKFPEKWWVSTLLFSSLYFIVAVYLAQAYCRVGLLPNEPISPVSDYDYINVDTVQSIASLLMSSEGRGILTIFDWQKIRFFVMHVYPLLFLPIFSVEFYIPLAVLLLEIGLPAGFYNQNSYYVAMILPFIFVSLIFIFKKLCVRWGERKALFAALLVVVACLVSNTGRNMIGCTAAESKVFNDPYADEYDVRFLDVKNIFDRRLYTVDADDKIAWEMLELIPRDAAVTVTGDLLPAVSSRRHVYEFGLNHPKAFESEFNFATYPNYDVDFILINKKCLINGLGGRYAWFSRKDLEEEIERLVKDEKFILKEKKGTFLLLMRHGEGI
jgi:hypothetical protein